jgi:hypothetical protein
MPTREEVNPMADRDDQSSPDEYISREQAAAMLGVTIRTVDAYQKLGTLRPYRIKRSRLTRFKRKEVMALFEPAGKK